MCVVFQLSVTRVVFGFVLAFCADEFSAHILTHLSHRLCITIIALFNVSVHSSCMSAHGSAVDGWKIAHVRLRRVYMEVPCPLLNIERCSGPGLLEGSFVYAIYPGYVG